RDLHLHTSPLLTPRLSPHPSPNSIYPLSLHDALPIFERTAVHLHDGTAQRQPQTHAAFEVAAFPARLAGGTIVEQIEDVLAILKDRKSTRLNSSHVSISYAVFCLKKKKKRKMFLIIYY